MGGTVAIEAVLSRLEDELPPILIVQHTLAGFTARLAHRLNSVSAIEVREAVEGEVIQRGVAYLAPSHAHLLVEPYGHGLRTVLSRVPPVHFHRPAVDVLFYSLAALSHVQVVAVLLTGMGSDGAKGLLALRRAGAKTIVQDEQSSAVFGMPKAAIQAGAAQHVTSLQHLPQQILACLRSSRTVHA